MRTVKILYVHYDACALPVFLNRHNISAVLIMGKEIGSIIEPKNEAFQLQPEIHEIIQNTKNEDVDFVVIGNNLGAGVPRATIVPEYLKPRTIVIWNDYEPGMEAPYSALGIKYFGSRENIGLLILKALEDTGNLSSV